MAVFDNFFFVKKRGLRRKIILLLKEAEMRAPLLERRSEIPFGIETDNLVAFVQLVSCTFKKEQGNLPTPLQPLK